MQHQDNTGVEERGSTEPSSSAHSTTVFVENPSSPQPLLSTSLPLNSIPSQPLVASAAHIVPRCRIPKKRTANGTGKVSVTTLRVELPGFGKATTGAQVSNTTGMEVPDNSTSVQTPQAAAILLHVARPASRARESATLSSNASIVSETNASAVTWLFARQSSTPLPIQEMCHHSVSLSSSVMAR